MCNIQKPRKTSCKQNDLHIHMHRRTASRLRLQVARKTCLTSRYIFRSRIATANAKVMRNLHQAYPDWHTIHDAQATTISRPEVKREEMGAFLSVGFQRSVGLVTLVLQAFRDQTRSLIAPAACPRGRMNAR